MNHLTPCTICSRHVRVSESACPFCGSALDLSDVPPPVVPARRLGRAALFTFSATLAAGLAAASCGSDDDGGGGTGGVSALYGMPGDSAVGGSSGSAGAAGEAGATSSGGQAGAPNTLYGLPPDGG
jgi:hypothetical protein